MASVILQQVTKRFGAITAVDEVCLEVREGEFLTLLGPSGCGKTTTLRLIAGFTVPSQGRIFIGGEDVTNVPPRKRNIGMVFQDYALFPHLTVAENVAFGLRERRAPTPQVRTRVQELLALVRLPGVEHRFPMELSGGQQQRVALARALAYAPRVLLMDEPLGALDLKLRETMQIEFHRIQRELGITTIYVTHDQEEAMSLSDRIAVMSEGRLIQVANPEELYANPVTPFVAHFVGKINFLDGVVRRRDGRQCLVEIPGEGSVRATAEEAFQEGQTVWLALRPESLALSRTEDGLEPNRFAGVVDRRRFLGNLSHYFVRSSGGRILMVEVAGGAEPAKVGDAVWIHWDPEDGRLFREHPAAPPT
jgi:spermidine/putrescine ABC transporter ATP-binding subunit